MVVNKNIVLPDGGAREMKMYETWTRIRVKASGQVIDMAPGVARAMVEGGSADLVEEKKPETAALNRKVNTAALPSAQPRTPVQRAQVRVPRGR